MIQALLTGVEWISGVAINAHHRCCGLALTPALSRSREREFRSIECDDAERPLYRLRERDRVRARGRVSLSLKRTLRVHSPHH